MRANSHRLKIYKAALGGVQKSTQYILLSTTRPDLAAEIEPNSSVS